MSTDHTPNPASTPNPEEVAQVAAAGAAAVDPTTQTPQQAQEQAAAAMRDATGDMNITLPQATIDAIATATIAQLEQRGAFDTPPPATPAPNAPAHASAPASADAPADAPTAPSTGTAAPPAADSTPPRKRTFAERFVGKQ